ncbi:MAG TPA: hypothetical protein VIL07_00095, partial [Symbiobacteriaceae bacterium]
MSGLLAGLLLVVSQASPVAASESAGASGPIQAIAEVHSELETVGNWQSDRQLWTALPPKGAGGVTLAYDFEGVGLWLGGYYIDFVDKTFIANHVREDPAIAIAQLGKGVCWEAAQTITMTGTISIQGEAKFSDAIKGAFGFSGSGTKTFTQKLQLCGPSGSSPYPKRTFYGVVPEIVEIQSGGPQAPFGITGVDTRKEVAATDVIVPQEGSEAPDAG